MLARRLTPTQWSCTARWRTRTTGESRASSTGGDGQLAAGSTRTMSADHGRDSGLLALTMLARLHGIAADPEELARRLAHAGPAGTAELLRSAAALGLKARWL